jgi:hypothetical protein
MPHPGPQVEFMSRDEFEVLYGGARGGGKSECLLMEALRYIEFSDYRAILFRRTFPELQDLVDRSKIVFDRVYPGAKWRAQENRWIFPSGAIVRFAHMQDENSKYLVLGQEYQYMGYDELTHFTESQYTFSKMSCRSTNPKIPARVRATSNPGNIGHQWVRKYFVKAGEPGKPIIDNRTGTTRCFIPATVYDNPTIIENDPNYVKRLEALPWREREMMLYGNWDVFAGQAFPEWRYDLHVIQPFPIPHEWTKFIALDWGYSHPFAVLWFAVDFYDKLYVYKEWYGIAHDEFQEPKDDVGCQLSAADVAHGIRQKSQHEAIEYLVSDPKINTQSGHMMGSIEDEMQGVLMSAGIPIIPGDNNRINGKNQIHSRLKSGPDGRPNLLIFSNCLHGIRTLPNLPVDENKPEDVDTKTEDHWYDALRYGCMSRPMTEITRDTPVGRRVVNNIEHFRFNLEVFGPMRRQKTRPCDTYG